MDNGTPDERGKRKHASGWHILDVPPEERPGFKAAAEEADREAQRASGITIEVLTNTWPDGTESAAITVRCGGTITQTPWLITDRRGATKAAREIAAKLSASHPDVPQTHVGWADDGGAP